MFHVYLPYDLPFFVSRFLTYFKPQCCFIMETEIWPNLFFAAIKKNIPICIVNARLSPRSFKSYLKLKSWVKPILTKIFVLTQSEADLTRYRALGVLPSHSENMGNIKFDVALPKHIEEKSTDLRKKFAQQPIWIAASTHAQEEETILAAYRVLKKQFDNLLLILVPRHPNRFDEVAKLCLDSGWHLARRSQQDWMLPKIDIYLGDTMGELLLMYSVSDVAFVGGSLVPVGGHNLLEPALFGVPVLTGPILHNFVHISDLLIEANHTQIVKNADDLVEKLSILLKDKDFRSQKGQAGKAVLLKNRGALNKLMDFVDTHLSL
jgi:3-deoxy-D-manno-octulosonic-acid transferase